MMPWYRNALIPTEWYECEHCGKKFYPASMDNGGYENRDHAKVHCTVHEKTCTAGAAAKGR